MSKKIKVLELIDSELEVTRIDCNIVTNPEFKKQVQELLETENYQAIVAGKATAWIFPSFEAYNQNEKTFDKSKIDSVERTSFPVIVSTWIHNNLLILVNEKSKEQNKYFILENYHG